MAFREAVETHWLPRMAEFEPQLILISAGFDAHAADPLANVNLSTECFGWMTERMLEVADRHAAGRLISLLEGGYDLEALAQSVALHLETLGGPTARPTHLVLLDGVPERVTARVLIALLEEQEGQRKLDDYLATLASVMPTSLESPAERLAYWADLRAQFAGVEGVE